MSRLVAIGGTVFGLALAGSTVAYGAAFDTACERNYTSEVCTCSKKLLMSKLDLKEFAFLAVAVKKAMKNEMAGMSPEDAWQAAGEASDDSARVVAPDMMGKTDELRATHLEALQECGG
jgi:hypothetical protein